MSAVDDAWQADEQEAEEMRALDHAMRQRHLVVARRVTARQIAAMDRHNAEETMALLERWVKNYGNPSAAEEDLSRARARRDELLAARSSHGAAG